jgi:arylsulfatase A-like enzyme
VVRKGDWKLTEFFEKGDFELYNLSEDPGETRNLYEEKPKIAEELRADLSAWRTAIKADIPTERNPEFDEEAEREAISRKWKSRKAD